MKIHFKEHPHIMDAFSNLLDATYKLMEARYECKLAYDVEVSNGACFGVEISEEMLALVLLKYSKGSSGST
jgi:hypothetical protein